MYACSVYICAQSLEKNIWCPVLSLCFLPLKQGLSLNLELHQWSARPRDPSVHLPQYLTMLNSGIWTQVHKLAQQDSIELSLYSSTLIFETDSPLNLELLLDWLAREPPESACLCRCSYKRVPWLQAFMSVLVVQTKVFVLPTWADSAAPTLLFLVFFNRILCSLGWPETCCVVRDDLKRLLIPLPSWVMGLLAWAAIPIFMQGSNKDWAQDCACSVSE